MGRSRESKGVILEELKTSLREAQLTMVIDYQGLTVAEISNLRRKLRPTGTICKVTKNTLMGLAIAEDSGWEPMKSLLSGTSAFLLVKEDIGGAFKAYQEFKKESKKTELRGGVLKEGTRRFTVERTVNRSGRRSNQRHCCQTGPQYQRSSRIFGPCRRCRGPSRRKRSGLTPRQSITYKQLGV